MKPIIFILAAVTMLAACGPTDVKRTDSPAPGESAVLTDAVPGLFASNVISTGLNERDAAMTADGSAFYFSVWSNGGGTICESRWDGRGWSTPVA